MILCSMQMCQRKDDVTLVFELCMCVLYVQVTREFFAGLPSPNAQQEVLRCLINLILESQRSKVVTMVKEQVVKVRIWANKIMHQLK